MQLTFLGNTYTASTPELEVTETRAVATFLGKRYIKKTYIVTRHHQSARENLTYRGVHYSR